MKIVYEDAQILVCHKEAGLATQTARISEADVVSKLKRHLAAAGRKSPYLGVIHRLDQPVEGLLLFAKDRGTAAELSRQLADGTINKHYYAVLCGKPECEEGVLVDYLIKDAGSKAVVVTGNWELYPQAQKAVLRFRVLEHLEEPEELTLVDVEIETGRFHQIRAQFAHRDMPLVGDRKYAGRETPKKSYGLLAGHPALCAYRLECKHPQKGRNMNFSVSPEGRIFSKFSYFNKN